MAQMKEQPICRVNTLEMAKHYLLNSDAFGLCIAISMALQNYGIYPDLLFIFQNSREYTLLGLEVLDCIIGGDQDGEMGEYRFLIG